MYQALAPCPSCSRHVRTSETVCPFCHGALPATLADAAIPGTTQRLSRAAAFAFTASLAVTACGGTIVTTGASDSGSGTKDGAGSGDTGSGVDTGGPDFDSGGNQPPYGIAPFDAAVPDTGPDDAGGGGAKYGGPPIDAGHD